LIPDFTDLNGNNLFIEDLINTETSVTGLFCAVNKTAFDTGLMVDGVDGGIDLIGHELERLQPSTVDFLSYKGTIVADKSYAGLYSDATSLASFNDPTITKSTNSDGDIEIAVNATSNQAAYDALGSFTANVANPRTVGTYIYVDGLGTWAPVTGVIKTSASAVVTVSGTGVVLGDITAITTLKYVNPADIDFVVQKDDNSGTIIGASSSSLYSDVADGIITDGDKAVFGTSSSDPVVYLDVNIDVSTKLYWNDGSSDLAATITDSNFTIPVATVNAFETAAFTPGTEITTDSDFGINQVGKFFFTSGGTQAAAETFVAQSFNGSLNNSVVAAEWFGKSGSSLLGNEVIIPAADAEFFAPGYYLVNNPGSTGSGVSSRLVRIKEVIGLSNYTPAGSVTPGNYVKIVAQNTIYLFNVGGNKQVEVYQPITNWFSSYQTYNLPGFQLGDYNLPDGTNAQQNNILYDTLSGTNLYKALIDKENITYRYIVDTFGNGLEANSKSILGTLAKDRQNALAIVNAPSIQDFKDSTDPTFKNAIGQFETRFIPTGGDLTKNPTVRYTLPGISQGSNYMAFYSPFLTVNDNGSNVNVPPAAAVSNNFIQKYTDATPWSIVAGARRGIVAGRGIVGLEYNFSKNDRDNIEPFGLNPIIFQNGTGLVIFGNKTAQQNVKSALSSVHVREVVIYIQDGIAAILKNYLFEFNTAQTRLEIKTLADNFMSTVQSENGVYDFRNIMDETNNTPEVIDQNVGILDTYIEPVKGMEILVHRTTILRTGQISTGNFI